MDGIEGENSYNAEDATWITTFSYGIVSGIASCNEIPGTNLNPYSGNQNNIQQGTEGTNCWCRMLSPVRSAWVFNYTHGSASACASHCANGCGADVRDSTSFRSRLYSIAGN